MKLLFVVNPRSGRGKAQPLAERLAQAVEGDGHAVEMIAVDGHMNPERIAAWRARADACECVVIFGGDGTVHHLLPALLGAPTPIYHVPMGTENLFARQFGMNRDPATLRGALEDGRAGAIDVGEANGRLFAIMCSAGPDAAVVRRLAADRSGAIRHSSYIAPIVAELFRPSLGPLQVEVDGQSLAHGHGQLIIGNSPMYALGLNPARSADVQDGLLDVVFLPARTSISLAWWACRAAMGSVLACKGVAYRQGREVVLRAPEPTPYQLDGDEGGLAGNGQGELRIRVRPGAVRVLRPPL